VNMKFQAPETTTKRSPSLLLEAQIRRQKRMTKLEKRFWGFDPSKIVLCVLNFYQTFKSQHLRWEVPEDCKLFEDYFGNAIKDHRKASKLYFEIVTRLVTSKGSPPSDQED